jgi:hypothetical protein
MTDTSTGRIRRRFGTIVAVAALVAGVPLAVIAADFFTDVPDSNEFHGSISWMKENGVTVGCNPPDNTLFCPEDNVTREQMASFMRRLAQTQGTDGIQVTDSADTETVSNTAYVELARVEATPKAEANVVLHGHVTLAATDGAYQVIIARGECTEPALAAGGWSPGADSANTIALSATNVISTDDAASGDNSYVLCAAETEDGGGATASLRGLTATWEPTA